MITPAGDIKDMTVPWLFQDLRAKSETGTLTFTRDGAVKKVYVDSGDVVFASSNLDDDRLCDCLLRVNKLTSAQFNASSELSKKTGKKQETILVELGFLLPHDLVSGVKLQTKMIILSLFTWRHGNYIFEKGPLPASDIIPLHMSTGNLILEGVRTLDWSFVRRSLPPIKTMLRPAVDPWHLFQSADLEPDHRTIFSFVDGKRSIEEICALSGLGDFNTLKSIYVLLALKMIEKGETKAGEEKRFAKEPPEKKKNEETQAEKQGTAEESAPLTKELIGQALDAMKNQTHYQVLGIGITAGSHEIKKAYFRLAKMYHPDRHFEPAMSGMKEKLELLFTRIHDAYETLSDPLKRQEYDRRSIRNSPGKPL